MTSRSVFLPSTALIYRTFIACRRYPPNKHLPNIAYTIEKARDSLRFLLNYTMQCQKLFNDLQWQVVGSSFSLFSHTDTKIWAVAPKKSSVVPAAGRILTTEKTTKPSFPYGVSPVPQPGLPAILPSSGVSFYSSFDPSQVAISCDLPEDTSCVCIFKTMQVWLSLSLSRVEHAVLPCFE